MKETVASDKINIRTKSSHRIQRFQFLMAEGSVS